MRSVVISIIGLFPSRSSRILTHPLQLGEHASPEEYKEIHQMIYEYVDWPAHAKPQFPGCQVCVCVCVWCDGDNRFFCLTPEVSLVMEWGRLVRQRSAVGT